MRLMFTWVLGRYVASTVLLVLKLSREGADRVGRLFIKECPFRRVWRKVSESDARSVPVTVIRLTRSSYSNHKRRYELYPQTLFSETSQPAAPPSSVLPSLAVSSPPLSTSAARDEHQSGFRLTSFPVECRRLPGCSRSLASFTCPGSPRGSP